MAPSPRTTFIRRESIYAPDGTYLATLVFHGDEPFSLAELPYLMYLQALEQTRWLKSEQERTIAG